MGWGRGQQSKKIAGNGVGNNMVGTGSGWDMRGRMGMGTDLAGWGGDDFHPHAGL